MSADYDWLRRRGQSYEEKFNLGGTGKAQVMAVCLGS
jgi:hypothetical protein